MLNKYNMVPRLDFVRRELRSLGLSFRKTDDGEFRINYQNGADATAYYTYDLQDALDTGRAMFNNQPK